MVFLAISTTNVVHRFIPPTQLLMLRLFVPFMLYVAVFVLRVRLVECVYVSDFMTVFLANDCLYHNCQSIVVT